MNFSELIDKLASDRADLADMLRVILDRADRPRIEGSAEIATQRVPAALIIKAREMLAEQPYSRLPNKI